MNFVFEQIRTGGDRNLAYLLGDRALGVAAIVDPSFDPDNVVERARAQSLEVVYIVNTHGHPDHTNGNDAAKRRTGARVVAWKDSPIAPDVSLEDGARLRVGRLELEFHHVPGHCDDHVLVHLPVERVALTGDLLFVGKVGGTSSDELARTEHASLQKVVDLLPDETTVWPGHDYGCRPASTIALEKVTNPFLLASSVEEFLALKRDWPRFKKEHGLR